MLGSAEGDLCDVSCELRHSEIVGELKAARQGSNMSKYLVSLASHGEEVNCESLEAPKS